MARRLDIADLLADPATRVVVCTGAGGVGKTTTAAAVALRAAELGRDTVVLTIDPARRLAQALGVDLLSNEPSPVELGPDAPAAAVARSAAELCLDTVVLTIDPARRLAQALGVDLLSNEPSPVELGPDAPAGAGALHAMMLDMRRTFDELVAANTSAARARSIMENRFYQTLVTSFAGTQEYMAMEKLGQLLDDSSWDLVVVDTPPSRNALDFLDAPKRLGSFL